MDNWWGISHLFVTVFLANFAEIMMSPAIPDVTVAAACPGEGGCSAAIYLTGVQQAVSGIGSVIMMPLIGNLSDIYGRKRLLTLPLILTIIPSALLAWKRTTAFVYAYYVIKTVTAMITQGGIVGISLAYLADCVSVGKRVAAFGIMSGVIYAAFLGGTFAARLLSNSQIFQVSAALSTFTALYMLVCLKDTTRHLDALEQPIMKVAESDDDSLKASVKINLTKKFPSPKDVLCLLRSSVTFSLAAVVAFFNSLAEAGLQACLLYFLKARFHFQKDQSANLLLIAYSGAAISNLLLVPSLGPLVGEEILLCVGTFGGFLNMFFDSIAWAAWVPLAAASMGVFLFMPNPAIRSIVSKQVGPNEQGLAQGCILGVTAFANIISPFIFSPLLDLFLSEKPPFHFQGFSILCVGLAWLSGFFVSIIIKALPFFSRNGDRNKHHILV